LKSVESRHMTRKRSSDNEDLRFIIEVNGQCPLCGKSLTEMKNARTLKQFQIAHIYPHSATDEQENILIGLEQLGDNSESFENRIALCLDCHAKQDFHTTSNDYLRLVDIKKNLLLHSKAMEQLSPECIGEQIEEVLRLVATSSIGQLEQLKLDVVHVQEKIKENYPLLIKVKGYVVEYFCYVQECFKLLESEGKLKFEVIASKVKTSYLTLKNTGRSQEDIFFALVEWLYNQTQKKHITACEIIIAFFVQDCEVFDVITE
jgi:hypothetical protein